MKPYCQILIIVFSASISFLSPASPTATAQIVVDDFTTGAFEQLRIKQDGGLAIEVFQRDLAGVLGGVREVTFGNLFPGPQPDPRATVSVSPEEGGRLRVHSEFGSEAFFITYGSFDEPLNINLRQPQTSAIAVEFGELQHVPALEEGFSLGVVAITSNRSSTLSVPFVKAHTTVIAPTSLFKGEVDVQDVDKLRFSVDPFPTAATTVVEIRSIRLIPEPSSVGATLPGFLLLCWQRRQLRRCSRTGPQPQKGHKK